MVTLEINYSYLSSTQKCVRNDFHEYRANEIDSDELIGLASGRVTLSEVTPGENTLKAEKAEYSSKDIRNVGGGPGEPNEHIDGVSVSSVKTINSQRLLGRRV